MRSVLLVALVLPLAACGGGKSSAPPTNMTPIAYVKSAATKTAQSPSEHVALKGSATLGTTLVTVDGTGDFDNAKKLGSMHADFSAGGLSGAIDEVLSGTTVYLQSPLLTSNLPKGKTWLKLDLTKVAPKGLNLSALTNESPAELLSQLRAAGNVTKVGDETINGSATTHYRGRLDASKLSKVTGVAITYGPDERLDREGRRLRPSDADGVHGQGRESRRQAIGLTMDFSDFGKGVIVSVPSASETVDGTGQAITGLGG